MCDRSIRSPLDPGVAARTATRTDPSARQRQWMGIRGNDNGGPRDDTLAFYFVMLRRRTKQTKQDLTVMRAEASVRRLILAWRPGPRRGQILRPAKDNGWGLVEMITAGLGMTRSLFILSC